MGPFLLLALLLGAGTVATASDVRQGKIYNRHLALFGLGGVAVYAAFYPQLVAGFAPGLAANALISLAVSFLFFYTRFWSAGDAKLFCLTAMLVPYALYPSGLLFPAFYVLMVTFTLAFVFAALQSHYYGIIDSRRPPAKRRAMRAVRFSASATLEWLLRYLAASLLFGLLYRFMGRLIPLVMVRDRGLVMIVGLLLLVLLYGRLRSRRIAVALIAAGFLANVASALLTGEALANLLDPRGPLIALVAIVVMQFVARYDHIRVPVTELKPGMVLSALTVAGFRLSGRRGLPQSTTETLVSALTTEQVARIREWGAADPADAFVVVVSHVPFAPFILAGSIGYVALAYLQLLH